MAAGANGNGHARFTASAVDALGLDHDAQGLVPAEESIEHLGRVVTYTLDLESRWQSETAQRRLDIVDADVVLDAIATIPAEPSVVWAHLTSPSVRTSWEGPLTITESSVGGRRGVGTTAQCVTGRLATLEEIVDWQPYDHVGWRLVVPGLGPVAATADLDAVDGGTRLRIRWAWLGDSPLDESQIARIRVEKEATLARLASVVADSLPVIERQEILS